MQFVSSFWTYEIRSNRQKVAQAGPKTFTEKCLDNHLMNWYIASLDNFFPQIKRVFIDQKDQDLYRLIDRCEGKTVVAIVNQWHMEGIEHHWCHHYGQLPRSQYFTEAINPIGDMNLREGLFQRMYNALHREINSSNHKSTPATYADWIIGYHREAIFQYEHRDM